MSKLLEADIQEFQQAGAIVLRGVFTEWVDTLRKGVDRNMAAPGEFSKTYTTEGDVGNFFGDYCNWDRIPEYRSFFFDSPAGEMAADLMQSQTARIFHEHVLVKEPGTSNPTPWHHDQPYYCVNGKQVVSFWIPLDTVPQATCPEFVSGSHAWGKWFLPRKFSGVDFNHTEEWLEPMPDIENQREDYDIRSWDLEPGDAIAFHYLTVHGAPPNKSKTLRRRGFAARWLGDDTTYAQRSGDMSPPFPGLEKRLNVGDPLDADEFPQIWPRN
jgi:ectoine hydroxylase-related dioxygenase (phytanoyl-CoA dioxygenase family)